MNTDARIPEKQTTKLTSAYVDAALRYWRESEDPRTPSSRVNRTAKRLFDLKEELLRQGSDGRDALVRLLEHRNPLVRVWAAAHAMAFAEEEATAVLRQLKSLGGKTAMMADAVLEVVRY